jgi:hypothetical protein
MGGSVAALVRGLRPKFRAFYLAHKNSFGSPLELTMIRS